MMRAKVSGMESGARRHRGSAASQWVFYGLAAVCVALAVPWISFLLEPDDSAPWWTTWAPVSAWVLPLLVGTAVLSLARGRRTFGVSLIVGDVAGFALFWATAIYIIPAGG